MSTKIKIRDLKNLIKYLDNQIQMTESFVMEHALVPIDYDDEAYDTILNHVKTAMAKLDSLYDEKFKLVELYTATLYKVVLDGEGGNKMEYSELLANSKKMECKLQFLKNFSECLWGTSVFSADRTKFIPVMPEFSIVNEYTKASGVLYSIERQLNDIDTSVEVEINMESPVKTEPGKEFA